MAEGKPLIEKYRLEGEGQRAERPQPQPQAQSPLTQFIPPKYEFRDGTVVIKTAEGRELAIAVRELVRMKPRELAERLGLKLQSFKELAAWKGEVIRDYFLSQPLRGQVEFNYLRPLYAHAEKLIVDGVLEGVEITWTLWEARRNPWSPPILILDRDGYVNRNRTVYSLALAEPQEVAEIVKQLPQPLLERLPRLLGLKKPEQRRGGEGEGGEVDARVWLASALDSAQLVFKPVPSLRSPEFLKGIDWRPFVDEQVLSFGGSVDDRLLTVRAVYALKGVEGRYLPHGVLVANAGSGKSIFFEVYGQLWSKVTANMLIGYAKSREEVYPGLIDGAEEVIAIDQIESADRANLARFLLDYMESGVCGFATGGVRYKQEGRAPLVFIGNPIGTGGEKDFQRMVEVISFNPALGGRIAVIFYFKNLREIRGREEALDEEGVRRWMEIKSILRAVEDYCRGRLRAVWRHPKVREWLKQPIFIEEGGARKSYLAKVNEIVGTLESETLREFFQTHASQAAPKIRGAALQAALLYNLKDIALGTYDIDAILREADAWLEKIVWLNIASIANIVEDYAGKREENTRAFFEALPDYLKAAVAAAEAYRRAVLKEFRGRGQVPEELRSVVLEDLKVSVPEFGYSYLSQALDRIKRWKGASKRFPAVAEYFGIQFTVLEGPEPRVQATVKRWEEAPIPVPERLVKEVEDVLGKVFLHFSSFSISLGGVGYGGSQSPAQNPESIPSGQEDNPLTHKPPRNGETGEMEKQESSTSFQDEKRLNEAGTGSILHQEPSEKKQFREFHKFTDFTGSQASEGGHSSPGVSDSGTVEEASRNKDVGETNQTVSASSGVGGGGAPRKSLRTCEVCELVKGTFSDSPESGKLEVETGSREALPGSERVSSMKKEERSVHRRMKTENEEGCPLFEGGRCRAIGSEAWFRQAVVEKGLRPPCLGGSDKCPVGAYRLEALRRKRREEEMIEEASRVWGV